MSETLNIVVPAAGAGRRFKEAGYDTPKPFLEVDGLPMLARVMYNVTPLMPHRFIVLLRAEHFDLWIKLMPTDLVAKSTVVVVNHITEGAACTVLLASNLIDNGDPLVIANSDQLCLWNMGDKVHSYGCLCNYPDVHWGLESQTIQDMINYARTRDYAGCIATFTPKRTDDARWSYAELDDRQCVKQVAEKVPISRHATVGIYYYRCGKNFVDAARAMIDANERVNGEFYVCPVYNQLLKKCRYPIGVYPVEFMAPMGTPEDFELYTRVFGNDTCEAFGWDGKLHRLISVADDE